MLLGNRHVCESIKYGDQCTSNIIVTAPMQCCNYYMYVHMYVCVGDAKLTLHLVRLYVYVIVCCIHVHTCTKHVDNWRQDVWC